MTDRDVSATESPTARPVRPAAEPTAELSTPLVPLGLLDAVTAEIETHLAGAGWDQPPSVFALVPTRVVAGDPQGARLLGVAPGEEIPVDALTPIAQDALPDQPLDEALGGIEWPAAVAGCAVSQEILILPPDAEAELSLDERSEAGLAGRSEAALSEAGLAGRSEAGRSEAEALAGAVAHPDRREARLVVAVTRDGRTASVLRIRSLSPGQPDDIAFAGDLAPNLALALRATLE